MTTTDWIVVAGAVAGGVLLGLILSRILHTILGSPKRPEPIRSAAGPLASLGFWGGVIIGLLVALGVISPEALDQLPKDIIAFLPRALAAAILVIAANVLASFATAALGPALARTSAGVQRQTAMVVRSTILGLAVLLAIRQLGIDTTVINLGVAAIFFCIAASLTLLIGLGGRDVASQVASTRAVKRLIAKGDAVTLHDLTGEVVAVHPTAVEVRAEDGSAVLVPSARFLDETVAITRAAPPEESPAT